MWLFALRLPGSIFPAFWEDGLFVAAAFVVGSLVGSFVNVVGYRMPLGRSVVSGRSACPACGRPVRARDNVPVLGWLMLRGRCRDCGSRISAAYAVVEAGCGLALAALAVAEVAAWRASGSSLPLIDRVLVLGDSRWLLGWLGRAVAILTVAAWALLARSGHVVAWRAAAIAAAVVAGLATAGSPSPAWGAVHVIGGAAAGWAAGLWARRATAHRILVLAGCAGGWPAVVMTVVLAVIAGGLRRTWQPVQKMERQSHPAAGQALDAAVAAAISLITGGVAGPAVDRWFRSLWGG